MRVIGNVTVITDNSALCGKVLVKGVNFSLVGTSNTVPSKRHKFQREQLDQDLSSL